MAEKRKGTTRIVLDSNFGGLPVNVCSCGLLILDTEEPPEHLHHCQTYLDQMEPGDAEVLDKPTPQRPDPMWEDE